ncbi:MAG: hypothetical protein C0169_04595 [Thermodesulfobacterium geofontis]|uniref:Uncharacterized protein n=1 Tax=Thermodesulfobacterium geofontis TaxID=1295609 RepID=A0A2N7QCT3_9BACT|nr:MAG: hypothetical protein C0169_04595 [Thermodesulfobacterium geofontis]
MEFRKAIVLSFTDFRLLTDLVDNYHSDPDAQEMTLEEFLVSEFEWMLEEYEADEFIVFYEEWIEDENGKLVEIKKNVYSLDPERLAHLMLDYLKRFQQ